MTKGIFKNGNKGLIKKGNIPWNKGKKFPHIHPKGMTGKKHTDEFKLNLSIRNKNLGIKPPSAKGKKQTAEHILKRIKKGEQHYAWVNERDRLHVSRNTPEYKEWRMKVWKRDNFTCQTCKIYRGNGNKIKLQAHHLKSFTFYPELRYEITNGITLCEPCHLSTENYGRKAIIKEKKVNQYS